MKEKIGLKENLNVSDPSCDFLRRLAGIDPLSWLPVKSLQEADYRWHHKSTA